MRSKYFTAKLFHIAKQYFTRRRRISLKKARFRVLFSGGDEEDRPTCYRNGRHAPGHRNSPPDCFYCFAIALFDPLLNKKTETICLRNDFCFSGGDEEDRTLDLTDANRTLSQLSYAPVFLTQIIIFFLFVFVKIFSFNPR